MTDTIVAQATLELLDPKVLVIGDNIRSAEHTDVTPEFIASIKERGVLEPIVAWRADDGFVIVKAGQRRTIAAITAGLAEVPVWVHPTEPPDVDRILDQWDENHQRRGMILGDEVAAVEQLTLFGVPADQIAKALHLAPEDIDTAVKIAKSPAAKKHAAEDPTLTLEYAELLADVEATSNGDESAIASVLEAAANGTPAVHVRARYESAVAEAKAVEEFKATLGDTRIVERPEGHESPPEWSRLFNLKGVTEENHQGCPGRAVYLTVRKGWREEEPWTITAHEVCTDWKANGHEKIEAVSSSTSKPKAADLPDAEREALKAERRRVIESNKAWKDATSVRAKWLLKFGALKEAPAGAEKFVGSHLTTWIGTSATHLPLVGLDQTKVAAELRKANVSAKRALHLALSVVVASLEDHLTDDAWRSQVDIAGPYLEALGKWGYGLSDIETRIVKEAKAKK